MNNVVEDEKKLIKGVLNGDGLLVRRLYARLNKKLMRFFGRRVEDDKDVEELIQDTFLHLLDALPLFRFQSSLSTFVMGIAGHELADYWRKKYAKRVIKSVSGASAWMERIADRAVVSDEMSKAIDRAYDQLKPIQAQLLMWKYEEEKSVKEIAERLGWSAKAVEAQLYRSRKAFQKAYVVAEDYGE